MKKLYPSKSLLALMLLFPLSVVGLNAVASEGGKARLTKDKPFITVMHEGHSVKVERIQDPEHVLTGYYAQTARDCPPFCLQPEVVAPGVTTIGEVELFDFMENKLNKQTGVLVDARTPEWYGRGTIPGSINVPFFDLQRPDSVEMKKALTRFGGMERVDVSSITRQFEALMGQDENKTEQWDFSGAKDLVLWCNSPQCGQSPRAIKGLLAAGYPPSKIFYYRGGMQMWRLWGLNTVEPGK
ncbi:MAG: rhodanese-like domain-containing protein [Candidatus Thiodiazotropha sp.]